MGERIEKEANMINKKEREPQEHLERKKKNEQTMKGKNGYFDIDTHVVYQRHICPFSVRNWTYSSLREATNKNRCIHFI